jgi:CHAT domain-containing protein
MTPGKTMIHVATHGFFIGSRCLAESESPLLRAGLAFAGANHKTSATAHEDGILTAEEVASLDLEKADWVVLSGCDTGVGELQTGEGVLGMRRAFRIAGARALVMSLWPVDDQETLRWMTDLYKAHLGSKLSATASVRAASRHQLAARRAAGQSTHPFYWAGFIAVDN